MFLGGMAIPPGQFPPRQLSPVQLPSGAVVRGCLSGGDCRGAFVLQWLAGYLGLTLVLAWSCAQREGFVFFESFLLVLAKLSFLRGDWALGYHSMVWFRHFSDIS